jgi:hypothetical protein
LDILFGYGEGTPANPVGLQRDELGGNGGGSETIVERKTYIFIKVCQK